MDDLTLEFIAETEDSIEAISTGLINLENNPDDLESVKTIFRMLHTIKGTCGFLGFDKLSKVAHFGENILNDVRDEKIKPNKSIIDALLQTLDIIRDIVTYIKANSSEPEEEYEAKLNEINAKLGAVDTLPVEAPTTPMPVIVETQEAIAEVVHESANENVDINQEIAKAYDIKNKKSKKSQKAHKEEEKDEIIKVKVSLLDKLMQGISELVLTRNQIRQVEKRRSTKIDSHLEDSIQRLDIITSELQESVLKTRMQPISSVWSTYPRVVRDIASTLNKKIRIVMHGEDTEIDRHMLDAIRDPLMHMIRNCGDHGIETPEDRVLAGKDETGTITLKASHQAGQIIISISDDGKGLDIERIKHKVVSLGLADEAKLSQMSDSQIYQFIFHPGFSTASQVTSVSGRGVGMDVVKTNIEKISGVIDLISKKGDGTEFILKIPLTLAIMPAMIVKHNQNKFAIPLICVYEILKITDNQEAKIEQLNNAMVLKIRGYVTPLIILATVLDHATIDDFKNKYIVICNVGHDRFGVVVDKIFDIEEIVVKANSTPVKNLNIYAGSTILGDGSIALIFDPNYLQEFVKHEDKISSQQHAVDYERSKKDSNLIISRFLTFRDKDDAKDLKAVPLDYVTRLEEIRVSEVEEVSGSKIYQYRDCLMRLLPFNPDFDYSKQEVIDVIVFTNSGEMIGLVVAEITDIVEHVFDNKVIESRDPMYLNTMVLQGKSTQIIDVSYFYRKAVGGESDIDIEAFEPQVSKVRDVKSEDEKHILFIDDSPFFRKFIPPVINNAGYRVTSVDSVESAIDILNTANDVSAIVTDLQMPGLNGSDLVEYINNNSHIKKVPIIALSAFNVEEAKKRGQNLELFSAFIPKTHHNHIVSKLNELVA